MVPANDDESHRLCFLLPTFAVYEKTPSTNFQEKLYYMQKSTMHCKTKLKP